MGNSPRYVGFLDPPYIVTLTDDSGNALDLTGCVSSSFTLTMLNDGTGLAQQGTGAWTIANQTTNKGQASYQWLSTDMATAGLWDVYTTVKLPSEPNPREFDPERMQILQGTVGVGIAPPGVVPGNFQPTQHTVYVDSYGADYTGVTDSTSAFQKALAVLPTITVNNGTTSATYPVGTLILGAGSYKLNASADIGNMGPFVSIIGPGSTCCTIYDYGQTSGGSCLNMHNAVKPSNDTFDTMLAETPTTIPGTVIDGFTIDGTHAGAGRYGLDIGDFENAKFRGDLKIQHYNKANSIGLNINNQYSWVNQFRGLVTLYDCTTHVVISGSGSPSGDQYNTFNDLEFYIYALIGQDGVTISNGLVYQFGSLKIRGCFQGSASAQTNAVLRLSGAIAGRGASISNGHLEVTAETDGGGGSNGPYSIYYGTVSGPGLGVISGEGVLVFNGCRPSNWTAASSFASGNFAFTGILWGDANLGGGSVANPGMTITTAIAYPLSQGFSSGGQPMQAGDFFSFTLTQNVTMQFQNSYAAPQRKTFVLTQAASGGPYTVTWPHAGSPTLSSPAVYWPGGVAPVMSTGANAIDKYFLETLDGARWYGSAVQNLS